MPKRTEGQRHMHISEEAGDARVSENSGWRAGEDGETGRRGDGGRGGTFKGFGEVHSAVSSSISGGGDYHLVWMQAQHTIQIQDGYDRTRR